MYFRDFFKFGGLTWYRLCAIVALSTGYHLPNTNTTPTQGGIEMKRYSEMTMSELKKIVSVSRKNKKLVPNAEHKFLIWNIPAVKTCPFRTKHCEKFCYARKAETAYPDCLPARERNFRASMESDFVELMTAYIHKACSHASYRNAKEVVVRIHESGDFYNQEYMDKWFAIASACADIPNVRFMAYTKSVRYLVGRAIPENVAIRYSVWDDTKQEDIELAEEMGLPIYTAVDKFTDETEEMRCRCEDCATCGKCWDIAKAILMCEIH